MVTVSVCLHAISQRLLLNTNLEFAMSSHLTP